MKLNELVAELLAFEEGYRAQAYLCSEGYATIGIGTRLSSVKFIGLEAYDDLEVSMDTAKALLQQEMVKLVKQLNDYTWFYGLDNSRKAIVVSLAYQLGVTGLLKFKMMIKAIREGDYAEASIQMLDSLAARQTPNRFKRQAEVMLTGDYHSAY